MLFKFLAKRTEKLFVRFPLSNQILYQLQHQTQSFIFALKTYVFDYAIDYHWAKFISHLTRIRLEGSSEWENSLGQPTDTSMDGMPALQEDEYHRFTDVFSVEAFHSATLDKILTACLLKAKHKSVGDALKECMAFTLDLGMLVRRMRRNDFDEEEGAKKLKAIHRKWHRSMQSLVSRSLVLCG
jgi:hypothetical protein